MKRHRVILLLVLYIWVFVFTIVMEYFSILNPGMRLLVNGSTLLMAIVSGALFWLIYRGGRQDDTQKKNRPEEIAEKTHGSYEKSSQEETEPVKKSQRETEAAFSFDKQKYLVFANENDLTRREAEIGMLVMNGFSNLQIAETLFIAETTVKKHLSHIYEKTGVSGRKEFRQKAVNGGDSYSSQDDGSGEMK